MHAAKDAPPPRENHALIGPDIGEAPTWITGICLCNGIVFPKKLWVSPFINLLYHSKAYNSNRVIASLPLRVQTRDTMAAAPRPAANRENIEADPDVSDSGTDQTKYMTNDCQAL